MCNLCKSKCNQMASIEHKKLQKQLHSAICWIKNYKSILFMTLVNTKITVSVSIPDFVYALTINLLEKRDHKYAKQNAGSFLIIEYAGNEKCCQLAKKTFKKIAKYCKNNNQYDLKPKYILPIELCYLTEHNIKNKLDKLDGFIKLFNEIIDISVAYMDQP